jgi:hypothetical protein
MATGGYRDPVIADQGNARGPDRAVRLRPLRPDDEAAFLRQSLVIARAIGIDQVLVTCDDTNAGSKAVIEACGGRLDNVVDGAVEESRIRRYWID